MLRLSIVIPALRRVELLENSLVSVLQHRPADTEVILVHSEPYADPHGLEGEIRLVAAPSGASLVETANLGFRHARGPIVHLLGCGAEVTEGWTDEPLRQFADDRVAAVASLVLNLRRPQQTLSAGVAWSRGGRAFQRCAGRPAAKAAAAKAKVLGPSSLAAFYRKSVLVNLRGLEPWAGDALADVEMALRIRELDMECRFEPQSLVYADGTAAPLAGFRAARAAERIYRRHRAKFGWTAALMHPFSIAAECLASIARPAMLTAPIGRLAARLERPSDGLTEAADAVTGAADTSSRTGLRLDTPHAARPTRNAETRKSWASASK
ncbi:MAG: glycosyltransferase family 2 protein [Pirellulales bacterium]